MKRGKKRDMGIIATNPKEPKSQEWRGHLIGQIEACLSPDGHVTDPTILASLIRIAEQDGLDLEALSLEVQKSLGLENLDLKSQYDQLVRTEAVQE